MRSPKLSEKEVKHVAKLAKLTLSLSEVKKFQKQLSEVLDYFKVLDKAKTENIEPTAQITGLENVFREDKSGQALSGPKSKTQRMFKTKAIFE